MLNSASPIISRLPLRCGRRSKSREPKMPTSSVLNNTAICAVLNIRIVIAMLQGGKPPCPLLKIESKACFQRYHMQTEYTCQ